MAFKIEVFTSPSCPYCPMAEEVVEEAKIKLKDEIDVEVVDITKDRQRAIDYKIMAVPAIAINGIVEFVGAPNLEDLLNKLKS
jgi:small redox-active disulfide protein 1